MKQFVESPMLGRWPPGSRYQVESIPFIFICIIYYVICTQHPNHLDPAVRNIGVLHFEVRTQRNPLTLDDVQVFLHSWSIL